MHEGFYRLVRAVARFLFFLLYPMRVYGLEHIPQAGAVLLCGNHVSMLDPIVLACATRRPVRFMAKVELFQNPLLGGLLRRAGMLPVKRGETDMAAMRAAMGVLQSGQVLGIYPQGTRDRQGKGHKFETGAAVLAQRSGAAVVPVRVIGPYKPFRRTPLLVGAPLAIGDLQGKCDSRTLQEVLNRLEGAVFALEPPQDC